MLAIAAATDSHPVLLPAVKAAFDELVDRGLGEFDIAVVRRFIGLRRELSNRVSEQ